LLIVGNIEALELVDDAIRGDKHLETVQISLRETELVAAGSGEILILINE
jgi:hypothetical protein